MCRVGGAGAAGNFPALGAGELAPKYNCLERKEQSVLAQQGLSSTLGHDGGHSPLLGWTGGRSSSVGTGVCSARPGSAASEGVSCRPGPSSPGR